MQSLKQNTLSQHALAKTSGLALLLSIVVGMLTAFFVAGGIDINLSANVSETAHNMLDAEQRVRAKAYLAIVTLGLELLFCVGVYLLVKSIHPLLAGWSVLISVVSAVLIFFGAVFDLNVAEFAANVAYTELTDESQRIMLTGLQATSNYTSFHLGLLLSCLGKAGFFYLFLKSGFIPKLIAGWGLFASLLVFFCIVARDFYPVFANHTLTMVFMLANMVALVSLGLYLVFKGVNDQVL